MVKTQTNRRHRLELKRQMRDAEICPHCSKRVLNLDAHIKREHGYRCDLCSKIFGQKQQWVNHMRDFHQHSERRAERGSKVSKIDAWLSGQRQKGKVSQSARAKSQLRRSDLDGLADSCPGQGMQADSDIETPSPQLPRCAECGAEAPREAALLFTQGLTYVCSLSGRKCIGADRPAGQGAETRAVCSPSACHTNIPAPSLFGSTAGAPPPTSALFAPQVGAATGQTLAAPAAMDGTTPLTTPSIFPVSVAASQPTTSTPSAGTAAALPFVPAAVSFSFGPAVATPAVAAPPVFSFGQAVPATLGTGVAVLAAKDLAEAASVPIEDDDDDL